MRTQLLKAGTPGPAGAKGDKGDTGPAGKDGANPATLVTSSGDAAWGGVGGGGTSPYPAASFSGGELRLQGGFDGSTPSGAIGLAHAYDNVPLSSLKTLSYDFRIIKRPAGNSVSAPTIHITLLKAATGTATWTRCPACGGRPAPRAPSTRPTRRPGRR